VEINTSWYTRYSQSDPEDLELAFRTWAAGRFLPPDLIELYWSELASYLKNLEEIRAKQSAIAQKIIKEAEGER